MGKAGRWLRNLFLPGRKGRKAAKDRAAADADDCQSVLSAPPLLSHSQAQAVTPSSGREKRRWSFRRPGASASGSGSGSGGGAQAQEAPLASSSSHCFSEADVRVVVAQDQEQDRQQQQQQQVCLPEAAPSSSAADTVVIQLPACGAGGGHAAAAAIRIQAAFRSYLARKALRALRGMVKLQAMVRGQLVRRQADVTLRRMQALVHAQRRARAERLRLLDLVDDGGAASSRQPKQQQTTATPRRPPPSRRSSPQHPRSRKATPPEVAAAERGSTSEENDVRIVEVDDGAPRAKTNARRSSSCCHHYSTTPSRTPAKAELLLFQQKVSPTRTPSARTDSASARTFSDRFDVIDDASFASASEPMPAVPSRRSAWRAPFFPSYMANTESSRARAKAKAARSQSAPRQRLSSASSDTALLVAVASPSPSCCERPTSRGGSGGSARRRASLDPMDMLGGGAPTSRRVERGASWAHAAGSECGSSRSTSGHRGSARTAGHGGYGMGGY